PEFENCPAETNPEVTVCVQGHTNEGGGGSYTVGPITVPILNSIVLQGGYHEEPDGHIVFAGPENGAQLIVPTPETVPGEPLGHVKATEMKAAGWPKSLKKSYKKAQREHLFSEGQTTEEIEAAGLPGLNILNLVFEEGVALEAPIKITGKNP